MIWILPEQLSIELKKNIKTIYVLFGNDLFLLKNSQKNIITTTKDSFNTKNFNFKLNNYFDWNKIFHLCKTIPLFKQRDILSLHTCLNYPIVLLNKNIPLLYSLVPNHLIIILFIHTSEPLKQHKKWIKFLNNDSTVFVNCTTTNYIELINQIQNQAKSMNINIDNSSCQLLCYYHEGNNTALHHTLQYLSLVYPNEHVDYSKIKKTIKDLALFDSNQWIEAVLLGNKNRANRILKKIIHINNNLFKLLHQIQYEILILIQIKCSFLKKEPLYTLFNKHKIYMQHRRLILSKAMQRLHLNQLNQAISLLIQMEFTYYQNNTNLSKFNFELLTEILCNNQKIHTNNIIINNII